VLGWVARRSESSRALGAWLLDLQDRSTRCILNDPTAEAFAWPADRRRAPHYSRRDDGVGCLDHDAVFVAQRKLLAMIFAKKGSTLTAQGLAGQGRGGA
jgi:hypothetical protein